MSNLIEVQWLGLRKDAGKGSIWGWFVPAGKPNRPIDMYLNGIRISKPNNCYIFWGKLGKTLNIERRDLTSEFLSEALAKKKNFKEADPAKIMSKWGKALDEELSMFLITMVLRG